jgi:hypothetical protein
LFGKNDFPIPTSINLDKGLLTFLVSGLVSQGLTTSPELLALRQMVDGAVDADRLDYVYRDAFHALGIRHTPDALINSISKYDQSGPILRHVRPVTDFMITRAMLWSNVYLSPENRLRIILLRIALQELCKKSDTVNELIGWRPQETTDQGFLDLHDVLIDNIMTKLSYDDHLDIGGPGKKATELLQEGAYDYEYRWVKFGGEADPNWRGPAKTPVGFYWDTYADYDERRHTLYDAHSVRIEGQRYSRLKSAVHLEDCIGPFCSMLQSGTWPALPMPKHMTWFAPHSAWDSRRGLWNSLFRFENSSQLSSQLAFNDPLMGIESDFDTRKNGFTGPDIFVAFAWEDRELIKRALAILYEGRRRYFVLLDGRSGFGGSPVSNSIAAVNEAEAVLLFASEAYVDRYAEQAEGAIHAEVDRMKSRKSEITIVPLAVDSHSAIRKGSFPWSGLSRDGNMAFVGDALRHMPASDFRHCIENALAAIDGTKQKSS